MASALYQRVLEMKSQGVKNFWQVLSKEYGVSAEALRSAFRREQESMMDEATSALLEPVASEEVETPTETTSQPVSDLPIGGQVRTEMKYTDSGDVRAVVSQRIIALSEQEQKDSRAVLTAHGFDPDKFVLVNNLSSFYESPQRGEKPNKLLHQSKITVKPIEDKKSLSISDLERYFEEKAKGSSAYIPDKDFNKSDTRGKVLVIPYADPHFGNGDLRKTADNLYNLVRVAIEKNNNLPTSVEYVVFVAMGDIMHYDNERGETTSGTKVGNRGDYYDVLSYTIDAMAGAVQELLDNVRYVHFIHISGNHDKHTSFAISKALEMTFLGNPNITFNTSFSDRKYEEFGSIAMGFTHGDMNQKNLKNIMQKEERQMYGRCTHHYMFMGHLHHNESHWADDGVMFYTLPSTTPVDFWHKGEGYLGSWRGSMCFLIDEVNGVEEVWYIPAI